mmetsp:Transcript_25224/g.47873  ORF Transcript_25224/g.47873 Transcript_25224/m.47873 type:complete len:272 (+) Transcript_25224:109-924(+)
MANKVGSMRSRRHGPNLVGGGGLRSTLLLGQRSPTSLGGMKHKDSMDSSCTSLTSTSSEAGVVISPPKTNNLNRKVRFAEENNQFYEPVKTSPRHAVNKPKEDGSEGSTFSTWYTRSDIARFQDETERQAVVFLEHDPRAGELYDLYQSFLLPQARKARAQPEGATVLRTMPQSLHRSSWRDANEEEEEEEDNVATRMIRGLEVYALPSRDATFWEGFRELQSRKTTSLYYKLFPERLSVALAHYCRQHSQPSQLYAWSIIDVAGDKPRQA